MFCCTFERKVTFIIFIFYFSFYLTCDGDEVCQMAVGLGRSWFFKKTNCLVTIVKLFILYFQSLERNLASCLMFTLRPQDFSNGLPIKNTYRWSPKDYFWQASGLLLSSIPSQTILHIAGNISLDQEKQAHSQLGHAELAVQVLEFWL